MIFVGQSLEITGDSMYPTLKNKERIVVEKVTYKSRTPKRGEIVVFRSLQNENIFLIKRVVAVPGDNFESQNENLGSLGVLEEFRQTPIPVNHFAVMGDNREESFDSRMFGLVPLDNLVGKAFVVYWPPARRI